MALREEKYHKDIISEIAKNQDKDVRVVALVATHPFLFKARTIRNKEDNKPIRDRYLGIFAIRGNNKK